MLFWVAVLGITGLVAAVTLARLSGGGSPAAAAPDLLVYRDQLKEIERDLARRIIDPGEAGRLRTEVSRRVLEADRLSRLPRQAGGAAPSPAMTRLAVAAVVGLFGGAIWLYLQIGAPGYGDLSQNQRIAAAEALRASRPSQASAVADTAKSPAPLVDPALPPLVEALRQKLADRPDDLQGHMLLAQNEAGLGNYPAAAVAQARVLAIKGDTAAAPDYSVLAELLILAAGGYVSPEAEQALTETLRRDPANPSARFYSGVMFGQTGRPDLAFRLWRPLLEASGPTDPWVAPIRANLENLAALAGVAYQLPPLTETKGPTDAQIRQSAEMSAEERAAMIGGMVDGLSARLAAEGGTAEEWAQLIRAYGVLKRADLVAKAWADAQSALASNLADLAIVKQAATEAGMAP